MFRSYGTVFSEYVCYKDSAPKELFSAKNPAL